MEYKKVTPQRAPLTVPQLREIQERNLDSPDALELLREIKRLHALIRSVEDYRVVIEKAWLEETKSRLAALHELRALLNNEPAKHERG
jgi:hypothetical protein